MRTLDQSGYHGLLANIQDASLIDNDVHISFPTDTMFGNMIIILIESNLYQFSSSLFVTGAVM